VRISKLLAAVALVLVAVQPAVAGIKADGQPPKFAGLVAATTCVPGPGGGGRTVSYTLRWEPATDNVTRPMKIVYDVYQASVPGDEDFSTPTYTTAAGATSFVTLPLPADQAVYFVVRARDKAGNSDANTVERQGQNLCL
jgi:hypothetical protein